MPIEELFQYCRKSG